MKIQELIWGSDARLRSGWRFLVFALLFVVLTIVLGSIAVVIVKSVWATPESGSTAFMIVNGAISLAVALFAGWFCGRIFESLPFRALGAWFTKGWLINLLVGLLLGVLTFALAAVIANVAGGLTFSFNRSADGQAIAMTLAWSFFVFAVAAAFEEALFRGYMFQTFVRSDLRWFAIAFTSAVFATVHNSNPSATAISWANTFIAGIWFAVAYLKTRDLWLACGLHLAWNWTQGSIFGIEVSGLDKIAPDPVMREFDAGPTWLTGGEYGVEGGVVTTIALIVSIAAIYFMPIVKPDEEMLALSEPTPTEVS